MPITFKFEKLASTGSPLYSAVAVNDNDEILLSWQIACDDESQLENIAAAAYDIAINPPKIEGN